MNEPGSPDEVKKRLNEVVKGYTPKLSAKNTLLFPFKNQIKELRERHAAYDDILLILSKEKISVSLNTLYRFCRDVIGEKSERPFKSRARKPVQAAESAPKAPIEKNIAPLRVPSNSSERYDGPWAKKKNGPRIADPKRL